MKSIILELRSNPLQAEPLFRGDDIKGSMDRFDRVSGNILDPNGKIRYNEAELFGAMAAKERGGMWWRWPLRGAIALGVLASLYYGWKKWRTA